MGNLNGRLSLVKMYDHFRKIGNKVIHFVVAHGYGAYIRVQPHPTPSPPPPVTLGRKPEPSTQNPLNSSSLLPRVGILNNKRLTTSPLFLNSCP